MARALLDHGAYLSAVDRATNQTLLHVAAVYSCWGSPEMLRFLLEQGSSDNNSDDDGDEEPTTRLDVNAVDAKGKTPLHYAVQGFGHRPAQALLEHGADPCAVDHCGYTPLYYAAQQGQVRGYSVAQGCIGYGAIVAIGRSIG